MYVFIHVRECVFVLHVINVLQFVNIQAVGYPYIMCVLGWFNTVF